MDAAETNNETILLGDLRRRKRTSDEGLDLYEDAIKEAYASCPVDDVILETIEILHPDITDESNNRTGVRIVNNTEDIVAGLEMTAPIDSGMEVTFTACPFSAKLQDISDIAMPTLTITFDNAGNLMTSYFEEALNDLNAITIIYRVFLSSDLSKPMNKNPIEFYVHEIKVDVNTVHMIAGVRDLVNLPFLNASYLPERFPGLVRG